MPLLNHFRDWKYIFCGGGDGNFSPQTLSVEFPTFAIAELYFRPTVTWPIGDCEGLYVWWYSRNL